MIKTGIKKIRNKRQFTHRSGQISSFRGKTRLTPVIRYGIVFTIYA
jgi:hypothetical protein